MDVDTQVFLSFKYHGSDGSVLPDYYMAKELYEILTHQGLSVFFSDESLVKLACSDYKSVIDAHLDKAKMVIVVSTSPQHCRSNWVRYEWDSFFSDLLSGRKEGELVSYLDSDDLGSFPRTIRTRQIFERKDGPGRLVAYVRSFFHCEDKEAHAASKEKGSSYAYDYAYELGDEKKRLAIQAKVESRLDPEVIAALVANHKGSIRVLDVGCSSGANTFDVFSGFFDRIDLLGVDKFETCVTDFNRAARDRGMQAQMRAECLDFESDGWGRSLERIMSSHGIDQFDLVYCALSLHHMSDSGKVVRQLWRYVANGGHIFIRTCDDALKVAYPHAEPVYELLDKTAKIPRVSDRYHGRKIYTILQQAKFEDIHILSDLIDTVGKTMAQRYALFYSAFIWRKNYFRRRLDAARSEDETAAAMREYDAVLDLLDRIEGLFSSDAFYFGYYTTIATAQKRSMFD